MWKESIKDLAEMSFEWVYSAEGEDAEEKFHEFVYGTITNGLFRVLLETSADCYIRFASEETEMGKDPSRNSSDGINLKLFIVHIAEKIPS